MISIKHLKSTTSFILAVCILAAISFLFVACNGGKKTDGEPVKDNVRPTPEAPKFAWDSAKRMPRWRADSPITWYGTFDFEKVVADSRAQRKPIFCYISRYENPTTEKFETLIFAGDRWGKILPEKFVMWEVNYWDDPILVDRLTSTIGIGPINMNGAPILMALAVSPEADSNELRVIEYWPSSDYALFPKVARYLESTSYMWREPTEMPDEVTARASLDAIVNYDWKNLKPGFWVQNKEKFLAQDPSVAKNQVDDLVKKLPAKLEKNMSMDFIYSSFYFYNIFTKAGDIAGFATWWNGWGEYRARVATSEGPFFPDSYFTFPYGAYGLNLITNLEAWSILKASGADLPTEPEKLFEGLYKFAALEDGKFGGGFPPYIDTLGTFTGNIDYTGNPKAPSPTESETKTPGENSKPPEPVPGPRDLVYINARILADWLRLVKWFPEFGSVNLPNGKTTREFLAEFAPAMIIALEEKAGKYGGMKLIDRIAMLDLYNEIYQISAEPAYLKKAGQIASTFTIDDKEKWFEPFGAKYVADLAVALLHYRWLADDEDYGTLAKWLSEKLVVSTSGGFPGSDIYYIAQAYQIVHSECIHLGVVAKSDDPIAQDMLKTALAGWDPRKIAQLLEPERDKDLIERKFYAVMDKPVAYTCIDDMCYPPAYTSDDMKKQMGEVIADLATEGDQEDPGN